MSHQSTPLMTVTVRLAAACTRGRLINYQKTQAIPGEICLGVAVADGKENEHVQINVLGSATVQTGGIFAAGDPLASDASGRVVLFTGSGYCVGRSLEPSTVAGQFVEMLLNTTAQENAVNVIKSVNGGIELSAGGEPLDIGDFVLSTFSVGAAPSGTIAANGALTLGTALNTIYSGGIYLYFPAGAVFSGSAAGAYYCVMSSTTAGVVYNNVLTGIPEKIAAPVSVVDAGPGAYVATTGSNVTLITAPVMDAKKFGLSGGFQATLIGTNNNSAGGKTTTLRINGTAVGGATTSTSTNNSQSIVFQNSGEYARNVIFFQNFGASSIGQARSNGTINTDASMTMTVTSNIVAATDWLIVDTLIARKLGNA